MGILYKPISKHDTRFEFPSKFHLWLKINGCWPTDGDANSFRYRLLDKFYTCWYWFVVVNLTFTVYAETLFFVVNIADVKKAVESMCTSVLGTMVWLRLLHAGYAMRRLKKLLGMFADKIWINKESHPRIFARCIKHTKPPFYLSISLWTVLLIYNVQPIALLLTTDLTMASPNKTFPYAMILPYDLQEYWNYIFTYIATAYTGCITVSLFYAMDALLALFISFASGQFDILHGSIARLIPECHVEWVARNAGADTTKEGMSLRHLQDIYTKRLDEIAGRHEDLIRFSIELEKFITMPLLINVMTSTFQICANMFQFIISMDTARYLYTCNWEGGRIWMNSPLLLQPNDMEVDKLSSKFPLWRHLNYYPTNRDFQHKLRLMIMRSHRPVQLTAMKFAVLSLETFSRILSSSISYFALLKSFLDKTH